jgi:hypothetical protein
MTRNIIKPPVETSNRRSHVIDRLPQPAETRKPATSRLERTRAYSRRRAFPCTDASPRGKGRRVLQTAGACSCSPITFGSIWLAIRPAGPTAGRSAKKNIRARLIAPTVVIAFVRRNRCDQCIGVLILVRAIAVKIARPRQSERSCISSTQSIIWRDRLRLAQP